MEDMSQVFCKRMSRGKTTISNAGISKRVFPKPQGSPAGLGPWKG